MANNFSNVMDGSRLTEQNIITCRLCLKQFMYYSDFAIHERMHFEQMSLPGSLQSGLRPAYDNPVVPAYSSTSSTPGTLDSFDKLIQPFRSMQEADIRSQTDTRNLIASNQPDLRNYVPSSPADHRNMAVTSPADLRNMVATSPGDPRNMIPSSPADPRNLIPSSPADTRNMVPSSPADLRNMVPASPVDPRNLVPASPVDPRNMVPASPVDPRNMVPASPVDPRNLVPASPVDPRNLVPASPAAQQDPRNLMVSSPASQSDKSTQQLYRSEMEGQQNINLGSRSTSINTQSPTISMATVPMSTDVRMLPIDTRPLQSQVTDTRHLPADSHGLTYSSSSFLDSLTRSLYSPDLTNKPMSTPPFSAIPVGRPEEILGLDSRQHPIQKPDPYYGIPKSIYHHVPGSEVGDSYTSNQYGLGKLLSPQQGTYYQQPVTSQPQTPQTHYGIDKLTATPLNYYNQPNNTDKSSIEQRDTVPKQTLHYGPSVQPLSTPNHSHYQQSIPRSDQQHLPNPSQHKVPNSTEQLQAYQSGPASPHLTYSQVYKGSQLQTQVQVPVPSHALPSQHDYKLSTEPIPTVNLEPKQQSQKITCYICHSPFSNMAEMSEHLKIHAQGMVSQNPISPQTSQPQQFPPKTGGTVPLKQSSESMVPQVIEKQTYQGISSVDTVKAKTFPAKMKYDIPEKTRDVVLPKVKDTIPVNCTVCGKAFHKQAFLIEHMKVHTSPQQYECRVCRKVFKKKSKCTRHEALHSRDIHLYYCEICDKNFEQKGKYLHHIQNQHTEQDSVHIHQHREHQAGTKKAVPLTGGSIDTTFDGVDIEKYIDCQICDEEIEKVNLVSHLKTHDVHTCDKCDQVFLQKTEYVEHLMSQHRKELADAKSEDEHESPKKKSSVKTEIEKTEEAEKIEMKNEVSGRTPKVNRSRKDVIKDLKEKRKEVMKNLKEKQKEIRDLENKKKMKEKKPKTDISVLEEKVKVKEEIKKGKIFNNAESNVNAVKLKFSCSKCEKSFAKNSDLIKHVETHVRDPSRIYCEVCDYSYHAKEKGYYIYHMKYHRDRELIESKQPAHLPCNICFASIPKETFVTHVKRAHSLYSCDICQWSYSSEKSLVKHMRSIHGGKKYKYYVYDESHYIEDIVEPEPTPEPPVVYKKLKDIKAEQQTAEKKKPMKVWTCQECNRTFTKKQNHEKHLKSHNITIEEPHIDCEMCQASLDSRGTYIYHLQQHARLENTTSSDVMVEKSEEKIEGFKSIDKNIKADSEDNGKTFNEISEKGSDTNDSKLDKSGKKDTEVDEEKMKIETKVAEKPAIKQTLITVLNPETGDFEEKLIEEKDEPEIMIDIKIFEDDYDKENENAKSEGTDVKEETKSKSDVVSEIVYCRLCNKCVKRNTLSEHMRTHLTYSCHTCQYAFTKKQRYVDHQRALHLTEYIAEEKEKFEQLEHSLSEESVHNESNTEQKEKDSHRRKRSTKMLNCPLCTSELKQDKYVEHLRSHDKLFLSCRFCERSFSKKNILAIHEKSHEFISYSTDELPYPKSCPVCETSMKSRKKYINHVIEHSKKELVKCKLCDVGFTSDRNLDNHIKICHDPHAKVYWKQDGEGLKFDTKTGRIHEVHSDYIFEIKELNELCKQFGKPAIWISPPIKSKEKSVNLSKAKESTGKGTEVSESAETSESDDKIKVETSDEDYVPERSLRKRKSGKVTSTDSDEQDDNGFEGERDKDYRPSKKKSRSSRYASDSTSEENYKPKSTRTRNVLVKKDLLKQKIKKLKQVAGRMLHSALEINTEKKSEKVGAKKTVMKRKPETDDKLKTPKKKRSEIDNLSFEEVHKVRDNDDFPEKCPECGIAQFSLSSYKEHARLHTGSMPFECPVCEKTFTRPCNMKTHMKHRHPDYKPKNLRRRERKENKTLDSAETVRKLRNRDKSPDSKPGTPVSSSTPIRGSRLVVKLSPIDVEERKKSVRNITAKSKEPAKKSNNTKLIESIEKKSVYMCEVCKKKFNSRWNYAQHIQGHKRDGKKKEKDSKTVLNKKEMKKKEKESKPFSCKDCSESFKKKRDLYIHTKIHSTDEDEVSDKIENINDSLNNEAESSTAEKRNDSSIDINEIHVAKNGRINESKSDSNNSSLNDSLEMSTDLNLGDSFNIDPETNSLVKSKKKQNAKDQDVDKNSSKGSRNQKPLKTGSGSVLVSSSDLSTPNKEKSIKTGLELNAKTAANEISKESELSKASNGCEAIKDTCTSVPQNNNDDHSRSGDSDSEKAKLLRQPSVNKMSAETAVSKWKAKVTELLSSQLDRHAAKQQEELANPEIKRVKEYLSVSGKGEKFKFECRICGDSSCDQESTFRTHMDVHLNEPPPHCSICDIYFMAIHPKRRLVEHNKKKHPELSC